MANIVTLIVFTIFAVAAFAVVIAAIQEKDGLFIIIGIIALSVCVTTVLVCIKNINKTYNTIPAIEVYRGNTSLQISYIDGVPQDTIVVYKHKVLHNL